ncbi:hypothetical protein AX17_007190 [Amanita inopinata Kibby_2008]|nr:hypothetical protein AX17_007190 [Amanita inopinata Kibby_2008]
MQLTLESLEIPGSSSSVEHWEATKDGQSGFHHRHRRSSFPVVVAVGGGVGIGGAATQAAEVEGATTATHAPTPPPPHPSPNHPPHAKSGAPATHSSDDTPS